MQSSILARNLLMMRRLQEFTAAAAPHRLATVYVRACRSMHNHAHAQPCTSTTMYNPGVTRLTSWALSQSSSTLTFTPTIKTVQLTGQLTCKEATVSDP